MKRIKMQMVMLEKHYDKEDGALEALIELAEKKIIELEKKGSEITSVSHSIFRENIYPNNLEIKGFKGSILLAYKDSE